MNSRLILKASTITVLMPGVGILLIPYFILDQPSLADWPGISSFAVPAIIGGTLGLIALLHSIWGFAVHGKGTLAPIDPPKVLVAQGLYRHTRNPMYLAVIVVLPSEATYFRSLGLVIYAAAALLGFHLFVVLYEEPRPRSRFGQVYQRYFEAVPRWWITLRGFKANQRGTVA